MNQKKLISVIVPVYKTEKYIKQCVDSILNQTYKNLEIILVDDGSPDGCPEICDKYAKQDDRVVVIHQNNTGLSGARNSALDICKGDYISFVDSDDWIETNAYEVLADKLATNCVDVVCFTANVIKDGKKVESRFRYFPDGTLKTANEMVELALADEVGGQVWSRIYSRKCWETVRFPEKRLYEDLAISFMPFLLIDKNVLFIDKAIYNYRMNESGISLSVNPEKNFHIFLGFKDHYDFATKHNRKSAPICLAKTAAFAIGYLNGIIRYRVTDHEENKKVAADWLKDNKDVILNCNRLDKKRRGMLNLYYFSPEIYQITYRIYASIIGDK